MDRIKFDDFDIVIRDRYYVKLDLILPEENIKEAIIFRIIYIGASGEEETIDHNPEVVIYPTKPTIFLHTYIRILEHIFKLDNEVRELIESNWEINPEIISFPNEFTMFQLNHYLHNYLFLHPFETYYGARLRLANLIRTLISDNIITLDMMSNLSDNIKAHKVELSESIEYTKK